MSNSKLSYKNKSLSYWLYGKHSVISALENTRRKVLKICCTENAMDSLSHIEHIRKLDQKISILTTKEITNLLRNEEAIHQGIALLTEPLIQPTFKELQERVNLLESSVLVLLDHVVDPHNVGAVMRSSLAFGVNGVIVTERNAPKESAALLKASSGAFEKLPFVAVSNIVNTIKSLQKNGYWVCGFSLDANLQLHNTKLDYKKIAIVLGSEASGLRRLTAENCDLLIKIAMEERADSLNISNACAIALHSVYIAESV